MQNPLGGWGGDAPDHRLPVALKTTDRHRHETRHAMNSNGLAKHYEALTPRERVPLIMAASSRGDEVERERLVNSAPKSGLRVANYFGFSQAVQEACFAYLLDQLNLAACFWRAEGLLASVCDLADHPKRRKKRDESEQAREDRMLFLVRWFGYRIVVNADAWRRFCAELNIETPRMVAVLSDQLMLNDVEECARIVAFSADEANACPGHWKDENVRAPTVDDVLKTWREFLDARMKWWDTE